MKGMNGLKKLQKALLCMLMVGVTLATSACSKEKTDGEAAGGAKKVEYVRGTLTENSFKSEYLNMSFEMPEGYVMATEEDLIELSDLGAEQLDGSQAVIDFSKANTVYEMMVSNMQGVPNISVMTEKLMLSNIKEEQYIESLKGVLESLGMPYTFEEAYTKEFLGQNYTILPAVLEMEGLKIYQDYMILVQDKRAQCIISTYMDDTKAEAETLLQTFKPYAE